MKDAEDYLKRAEELFKKDGLLPGDLKEFKEVLETPVMLKVIGSLTDRVTSYGAKMLSCNMQDPEQIKRALAFQSEARGLQIGIMVMLELGKRGEETDVKKTPVP